MWNSIIKILCNSKFYIPAITIIVIIIIIKIMNKAIKKLLVQNATKIETKKRNTIINLTSNIVKYIVIILGALIILSEWGVNVTGIIAGLGIAGVVGGLALQDALKDIIMGCNIILDNFYVVGDFVSYGDFTGEVIEFGLKNTKIRNANNEVLVISNRNIDKVINYSQSKFIIPIIVNVSYEDKNEKVEKIMHMLEKNIKDTVDNVNEITYVGIKELADSSVKHQFIIKCNPTNQYQIKRDVNKIIKETLDDNNIKIPYNQLEVHNGK